MALIDRAVDNVQDHFAAFDAVEAALPEGFPAYLPYSKKAAAKDRLHYLDMLGD